MKRRLSFLVLLSFALSTFVSVMLTSAQTAALTSESDPFPDVDSEYVNAFAISKLKSDGILEGYPDGNYVPQGKINRAEFLKILVGAAVDNPTGANCFPDVRDEWFAPFVCEAAARGIVEGHPDGTFKPADDINFSEAAKIMAKMYAFDAQDTSGDRWFEQYVEALDDRGAIPLSVEFFDEELTRDEMAEMIWRLKDDVDYKATRTYREINGDGFVTVDSCAALNQRLWEQNRYQYYYDDFMIMEDEGRMMMEMDAAMGETSGAMMTDSTTTAAPAPAMEPMMSTAESANTATQDGGSADYSKTNVQVEGVDEADIIKNDGEYIYIIKNGTIRIVDAYPAENMQELVSLSLGDEGEEFWPSEMYVDGDELIVIGSEYLYALEKPLPVEPDGGIGSTSMIVPEIYPYYNNRVKVYVIDITDRSQPSVKRSVAFDGNYHTSRKANDTLYLVMNQWAHYPAFYDYYDGHEPMMDNDVIVPRIMDSVVGEEELMTPCRDIRILPKDNNPNFLMTAAIPLNGSTERVVRNVLVGNGEQVYASRSNLYVAATDWSNGYFQDTYGSAIYRFALGRNSIKYEAKGRVPGTVLNQFSMDEHAGYFRIATTSDSYSPLRGSLRLNNMYVLNKDMDVVGNLEGLAPGESIFSVRFMGDKAYMVTFKRVDPLFVIGLSDPTNPELLGELKIPGFSNYLHPYDENHIIGFGKEVDPGDSGLADDDFILWDQVQGLKIGLFDVTDVNNPKEMFSEVIGDQGTESQLLYNHKALLFDKEKDLLAFPVSVYEYQDTYSCQDETYSSCPSDCQKICVPSSCTFENGITVCTADCDGPNSCIQRELQYGQKVFEGAYVYDVNLENGFNLRGKVNHHNEEDLLDLSETGWVDYSKAIERLLYIGENLYSISQHGVKANDLNSLEEINFITLAGSSDNYWEDTVFPVDATMDMVEPAM